MTFWFQGPVDNVSLISFRNILEVPNRCEIGKPIGKPTLEARLMLNMARFSNGFG
jgi:hypothetical protein